VEAERAARAGLGVEPVGEPSLDARALIEEGERSDGHLERLRGLLGVVAGLGLDARQGDPGLLRLDDTHEEVAEEEQVVGGAAVGLELAERHA
jgi:hypothetical protein